VAEPRPAGEAAAARPDRERVVSAAAPALLGVGDV